LIKRGNIINKILGLAIILFLIACGSSTSNDINEPHYFIAIHFEPDANFELVMPMIKDFVDFCNERNIKITFMFTPQWADWLNKTNPDYISYLESEGHEIAGHHHSIYNPGTWDGYTFLSEKEAMELKPNDEYLGTLSDLVKQLTAINPSINSGCMNDEEDKRSLPAAIIYDTCSGYANHDEPWTVEMDDNDLEKGRNDYITKGKIDGVDHYWLTHTQVAFHMAGDIYAAYMEYDSAQVMGLAAHHKAGELNILKEFLDLIYATDPDGSMSKTINEIMEGGYLTIEQGMEGD
jgi:hypothetical protein